MNFSNMNLNEIQMLAMAANAAAAAAQQQQQHGRSSSSNSSSNSQSTSNALAAAAAAAALAASSGNSAGGVSLGGATITPVMPQLPKAPNHDAIMSAAMAATATPPPSRTSSSQNGVANHSGISSAASSSALDPQSQSKYQQLLSVIEEMSKDIRPTYAGSKSSAERLKRGIVYARILVRECLVETERSART